MTVRIKILAISVVLLLLFAGVLAASVAMQRRTSHQVAAITEFHLPLAAVIADLDVATDQYELIVERLLLLPEATPAAVEAGRRALDMDKARIADDFQQADALLDRALADPRTDPADRLVLARVQRSLVFLKRLQAPFFAVGEDVVGALGAGRAKEARALASRFKPFEQAWGPDMGALRRELADLAKTSAEATYAQETRVLRLNLLLFAIAVVLGLGLSAMGARRLVRALWRLVEGVKAIEAGDLAIRLPVTSRDEIGQLAEAFNSMAGQLRSNERIKDTFGKYVDPRVVAQLIDTTKEDIDQAERRIATVMFSDLRGFTTISEQLTATAMVGLLNRYFTVVAEQIRAHNGIVEKYIGDAIVAFWTPPFAPGDSHAASACLAALAHRDAVIALRPELPQLLGLRRNVPDLTVRMGLATGEVVVGTVGAPTAKTFAAIGDTTNLASRLEGVNKVYGTTVIVAEETHRLAQEVVDARELDIVIVVGKSEPIRIFELLGPAGSVESGMLELRDLYVQGLDAYRQQDWDTADQRFQTCLRLRPEDGPSRVLLERIAAFREVAPAPGWSGVWRLGEK
jgi:adenylate cyclase